MSEHSRKTTFILALLIGCCAIASCITITLSINNPDFLNSSVLKYLQPAEETENNTVPEESDTTVYRQYTNTELGFSLDFPQDWKVEENDNEVEILTASGDSGINIEVQYDPSLSGTELNQETCTFIGQGFRSNLGLDEASEDFAFKYRVIEI